MMAPTVGRIVHFTWAGNEPPWPAVIATVGQGDVSLYVMDAHMGAHWEHHVKFSEGYQKGCWSWPPR